MILIDSIQENDSKEKLYTEEETDYLMEIAFGSTYGSDRDIIRKWSGDVGIKIFGSPTSDAEQELRRVIKELNKIVHPVKLNLVDEEPSIQIYFVHPEKYGQYILDMHNPGADGYVRINYNSACRIQEGTIIISTEVSQKRRLHLIREEITQSLGILRDSYKYPNSIFYQGLSDVTEFVSIDRKVVEMPYKSDIRPCMKKARGQIFVGER